MADLRSLVLSTPHSGIRRMLEHAWALPSPVMLVSGDPNFITPTHIIDAAADAARAGATGYSPGDGLLKLREAIARKLHERNQLDVGVDQVCVTTGACGGLYTTLMMLIGPGDEILLPNPGWSNYAAMVHVLGATAVGYRLAPETGWGIDLAAVEDAITPKTRAILVNSPGNPTGGVESKDTLLGLLELAKRYDIWVISDEAYDELVFESTHTSVASLGAEERVVSIFSFSKTYAMTGWRVGYVTGPRTFVRQVSLHQEPVVSCASTISQHAALAALAGPQDCVSEMVTAYRRRRDIAAATLTNADIPFVKPLGSFFLMVDCRMSGLDSWTFALKLLEEQHVAVVPGAAFGDGGEGYLRISLAAADASVAAGVEGLVRMLLGKEAMQVKR